VAVAVAVEVAVAVAVAVAVDVAVAVGVDVALAWVLASVYRRPMEIRARNRRLLMLATARVKVNVAE